MALVAILIGATGCGGSEPKPAAPFERGTSEIAVHTKQRLGGQWEVFFVPASGRAPLAAAKACVQAYLSDAKSAFCYAFDSDAALDAANIDPNRGAMKRLCWSAMAGRALSGDESSDGSGPGDSGCP